MKCHDDYLIVITANGVDSLNSGWVSTAWKRLMQAFNIFSSRKKKKICSNQRTCFQHNLQSYIYSGKCKKTGLPNRLVKSISRRFGLLLDVGSKSQHQQQVGKSSNRKGILHVGIWTHAIFFKLDGLSPLFFVFLQVVGLKFLVQPIGRHPSLTIPPPMRTTIPNCS